MLLLQVIDLLAHRESAISAFSTAIQSGLGGDQSSPSQASPRHGEQFHADGRSGWMVEPLDSLGDLLLSEIRGPGALREHVQKYRVINREPRALEFMVNSPSCGCLGFERDGVKLAVGAPWVLAANARTVITARFPLPNYAGGIDRAFDLDELKAARRVSSRRLIWRVAIHDDLIVNPPLLRCAHRNGVLLSDGMDLSITVCAPAGDSALAPVIELPENKWLRLDRITPDGGWEKVGSRLRRQRFHAVLNVDAIKLRNVAAGSAGEVLVRARQPSERSVDANSLPTVNVPVSLQDAAQLDAPALIHFGVVRAGTTVKRNVLVSSRDARDFLLHEASAQGAGHVEVAFNDRAARYHIISVSFTSSSPGEQGGKLSLVPATEDYDATTIDYRATVRDRP